jgi:hypothetical protein
MSAAATTTAAIGRPVGGAAVGRAGAAAAVMPQR